MTETNINNNDKKIKLLIIGIIMNCAGTEKSFLAFANNLDYSKYDVTLLLAKKEGKLIDKIPQQIKIKTMDQRYADLFLLSAPAFCSSFGTIVLWRFQNGCFY